MAARRAAIALVLLASGCQYLLGIDDPVAIDAGACAHTPCDLVGSCGCTAGDTCSWNPDQGESYCRNTDGNSTLGEICNLDTDCEDGAICVVNVCRKACLRDQDCNGTHCVLDFSPLVPELICAEACTPVSNAGCPGTDTCVPLQSKDGAFCIPGDAIAVGDSCVDHAFSCVPGAFCWHDPTGSAGDICRRPCDPQNGGTPCTGACIAQPDLMVAGVQYGLCP